MSGEASSAEVYCCTPASMLPVSEGVPDELPGGCYVMWLKPGARIRQAPVAGWYIVLLDDDGLCYDGVGTYDTPQEAFEHARKIC